MKTVLQWFNMLPYPYGEMAKKNILPYAANKQVDSMIIALGGGMKWWHTANEGEKFWLAVYRHFKFGSPLPELTKPREKDGIKIKPIIEQP